MNFSNFTSNLQSNGISTGSIKSFYSFAEFSGGVFFNDLYSKDDFIVGGGDDGAARREFDQILREAVIVVVAVVEIHRDNDRTCLRVDPQIRLQIAKGVVELVLCSYGRLGGLRAPLRVNGYLYIGDGEVDTKAGAVVRPNLCAKDKKRGRARGGVSSERCVVC